MMDRRMFSALLAAALTAPQASRAQPRTGATMFYASVGPELTFYQVDADGIELSRQGFLTLPANVQYAWPHPSANILYAAWSNGGPGISGDKHGASALSIDPGTGALRPHGPSAALRSRPIHISIDRFGAYALIAHNDPSGVTVLQINDDGSIGDEVKQRTAPDVGIFAHQIRVMPSGKAAVLVTRGNDPAAGKPEDPGALEIFGFDDGQLTNRASIAPEAVTASDRDISIFIRRSPGSTSRSSARTRSTSSGWRTTASIRSPFSARTLWPNRAISGPDSSRERFMCTRMGSTSMSPIDPTR